MHVTSSYIPEEVKYLTAGKAYTVLYKAGYPTILNDKGRTNTICLKNCGCAYLDFHKWEILSAIDYSALRYA